MQLQIKIGTVETSGSKRSCFIHYDTVWYLHAVNTFQRSQTSFVYLFAVRDLNLEEHKISFYQAFTNFLTQKMFISFKKTKHNSKQADMFLY